MLRWRLESLWLIASILAVGLILVVYALANEAPTAIDAFAAFLAVVGGTALYLTAGIVRLVVWGIRLTGKTQANP